MSKTLSLREMIQTAAAELIQKELAAIMGTDADTMTETVQRKVSDAAEAARERNAEAYKRTVERIEARPKRQRNRAASVAYATNYDRRHGLPEWMSATTAKTFAALLKSRKPLTNAQLVSVTGQKVKTVESDVWRLRNYSATGARVKPGARALIQSVPVE